MLLDICDPNNKVCFFKDKDVYHWKSPPALPVKYAPVGEHLENPFPPSVANYREDLKVYCPFHTDQIVGVMIVDLL